MVSSIGPILEVVVDSGRPVCKDASVLAYLALDHARERGDFGEYLGPCAGPQGLCSVHV